MGVLLPSTCSQNCSNTFLFKLKILQLKTKPQIIKHPNIKNMVVVTANQDFRKVFILEDLKIRMCRREIGAYSPK